MANIEVEVLLLLIRALEVFSVSSFFSKKEKLQQLWGKTVWAK